MGGGSVFVVAGWVEQVGLGAAAGLAAVDGPRVLLPAFGDAVELGLELLVGVDPGLGEGAFGGKPPSAPSLFALGASGSGIQTQSHVPKFFAVTPAPVWNDPPVWCP